MESAYAQNSQEREFTLRQQLTYHRKEPGQPLSEYLRSFKGICDSLAPIGQPLPDKSKVYSLLANLGPKYESFTTTMLKPLMPSYSEVVSHLQGFEQRSLWSETSHSPSYAFYGQRNQKQQQSSNHNVSNNHFLSKGRGFSATNRSLQYSSPTGAPQHSFNNAGRSPRPPPPGKRWMTAAEREMYKDDMCQLCGRQGHIAKICWSLPGLNNNDDLPQALASLTLDTSIADTEWTTDTGASNHMTANAGMLSNIHQFKGSDFVVIDDGSPLTIDAVGDTVISDGKNKLLLRDVLLVPELTRNLLSIIQLTSQYPLSCNFSNDSFHVKDQAT